MKTTDKRKMQKTEKQTKTKKSKGDRSYSERKELNDFFVHLS